MKTLDLGCGANKEPGAVGLDRVASVNPDVVHDLETYPYPFEDATFDRVIMSHVVEHIGDLVRLMEEIHRIARPGAIIEITTPHYSCSNSWTDPTHKQHLGFFSFEFFTGEQGRINFYSDCRFEIVSKRMDFFPRFRWLGIEYLANRFPRTWEKYFCYRYPARNMYVTLAVVR